MNCIPFPPTLIKLHSISPYTSFLGSVHGFYSFDGYKVVYSIVEEKIPLSLCFIAGVNSKHANNDRLTPIRQLPIDVYNWIYVCPESTEKLLGSTSRTEPMFLASYGPVLESGLSFESNFIQRETPTRGSSGSTDSNNSSQDKESANSCT
ncbi:hypothetical protein ACOME3_010310 [Neoechinorhynchus agilis]